jgi:hypothetical protein
VYYENTGILENSMDNRFGNRAPMSAPCYLTLDPGRDVLAEMGVELTPRQMKRAPDKDAQGRTKFPFFIDTIEEKLRIEKGTLVRIYRELQNETERVYEVKYDRLILQSRCFIMALS